MFRKLRAEEIECRIQSIKDNGLSLLLYKDARCDMRILDETVGADRWQRNHEIINGNLFCNVSIKFPKGDNRDFDEWVCKQDVGTESNTEAAKGQSSDSFKRACFNWGIGRELYTAPFIWINASDCKITKGRCYDKFIVKYVEYDETGNINKLEISNESLKRIVFKMGTSNNVKNAKENSKEERNIMATTLQQKCIELNLDVNEVATKYKINSTSSIARLNEVLAEITKEA